MALRSVAVLLQEPVALFEYGVLAEVFGIDRVDEGIPAFDYRVCA
jgi:AraC family transcriptional regulator, transcriptional activator FtrA